LYEFKVIDFGLAAIKTKTQTSFNAAMGTPFFVAPEVIDTKIKYDEKCDLWSCGVIFFVLLTG
jgi:serine/threonine protein kinase